MRVIFMGTPAFAVPALTRLIADGFDLVAVYTQPPRPAGRGMKLTPSPVQQLAEQHGIKVHTPISLKPTEAQAEFAAHAADIAVVVAYGMLLPEAILRAPRLGCINIHPSDLPRWRGAAPLQRTIMAGDTHTACCIMQMDAGLDTGDVLARRAYSIPAAMNVGALHDVMANMGADMLPDVMRSLAAGNATPQTQSENGATYAKKITKEDAIIDWRQPASAIAAQIRGLAPSPGATTELHGEAIKILAATIIPTAAEAKTGDLSTTYGLSITCGDGATLRLDTIKRAGKQAQPSAHALRGWLLPPYNIFANKR